MFFGNPAKFNCPSCRILIQPSRSEWGKLVACVCGATVRVPDPKRKKEAAQKAAALEQREIQKRQFQNRTERISRATQRIRTAAEFARQRQEEERQEKQRKQFPCHSCGTLYSQNDIDIRTAVLDGDGQVYCPGHVPTLQPCPDCSKEISRDAITCPHCGKPLRSAPKPTGHRFIRSFGAIAHRSGLVTTIGVLTISIAALYFAFTLFWIMIMGSLVMWVGEISAAFGYLEGVKDVLITVFFVTLFLVVYSAFPLIAGIGILKRRKWGQILGVVFASLITLERIYALVTTLPGMVRVTDILFLGYGIFSFIVLFSRSKEFEGSRIMSFRSRRVAVTPRRFYRYPQSSKVAPWLIAGFVLLAVGVTMYLVINRNQKGATSSAGVFNPLVGKWESYDGGGILEFSKDGSFTFKVRMSLEEGGEWQFIKGTFKFMEGNRYKAMPAKDNDNPWSQLINLQDSTIVYERDEILAEGFFGFGDLKGATRYRRSR